MHKVSPDFIKRLASKDHEAFLELFDMYYMSLYAIAVNYVADGDTADDIVQETLIYLYENSQKLQGVDNMGGFLRVVLRRRCLNHLKSLEVDDRKRILYRQELALTAGLDDLQETELDTNVYLSRISAVIETLPESCREICRLRFVEGHKIDQIAEALSVSAGTVKTQLSRARGKIRKALEEGGLTDVRNLNLVIVAAVILSGL